MAPASPPARASQETGKCSDFLTCDLCDVSCRCRWQCWHCCYCWLCCCCCCCCCWRWRWRYLCLLPQPEAEGRTPVRMRDSYTARCAWPTSCSIYSVNRSALRHILENTKAVEMAEFLMGVSFLSFHGTVIRDIPLPHIQRNPPG